MQRNPSAKTWLCLPGWWTKSTGAKSDPNTPADLLDSKVQTTLQWESEHADLIDYAWANAIQHYFHFHSGIQLTYYTLLYQCNNLMGAYDKYPHIQAWVAAHPGVQLEEFFLHYSEETRVDLEGGITIPAYGPGNEIASRVREPGSYGSYLVWRINLMSQIVQAWYLDWLSDLLAWSFGNGGHYEGPEFDVYNHCSRTVYPELTVLSGGAVYENELRIPNAYDDAAWYLEVQNLLTAMRAAHPTAMIGGNLSGYPGFWPLEQRSSIIRREHIFSVATWDTQPGLMAGVCGRFSARGGRNFISHNMWLAWYLSTPQDRAPAIDITHWLRDKLFGLAAFYLIQNPDTDYYHSFHTFVYEDSDIPISGYEAHEGVPEWDGLPRHQAFYTPAVEVDIGQPSGALMAGKEAINIYDSAGVAGQSDDTTLAGADAPGQPVYPTYIFKWAEGTDAAGTAYTIFGRLYTKALVLTRHMSSGMNYEDPTTFDATHISEVHALGATYYPVDAEGNIGEGITEIQLRVGEGAILLMDAEPTVTDPGIPGSVVCTAGNERNTLTWAASVPGSYPIGGYAIYRGTTEGGSKTLLATVGAAVLTYADTAVQSGIPYYYTVKAYDNASPANYSDESAEVSGTPTGGGSGPTSLLATAAAASMGLQISHQLFNDNVSISRPSDAFGPESYALSLTQTDPSALEKLVAWGERYTLPAGQARSLDLQGTQRGGFGEVVFDTIQGYAFAVETAAGDGIELQIGGDALPVPGFESARTYGGGDWIAEALSAAPKAVTADTAERIRIYNSGDEPASYLIWLVGTGSIVHR